MSLEQGVDTKSESSGGIFHEGDSLFLSYSSSIVLIEQHFLTQKAHSKRNNQNEGEHLKFHFADVYINDTL